MNCPALRTQGKLLDPSSLCIDTSKIDDLQNPQQTNLDVATCFNDLVCLKSALDASRSLFTRSMLNLEAQIREYGADFVFSQMKGEGTLPTMSRRLLARRSVSQKESANHRGCISTSDRVRTGAISVWSRVEVFYGPLPTDQELDALFAKRNAIPGKFVPENVEHWSRHFLSPSVRANDKAVMPPGPPPSESDIAPYWKKSRALFQIEKMQRHNSSVLHRLLNAMVVAGRQPPSGRGDRNAPVFVHALLPHVNVEYAKYGFDERLAMELESLGLSEPSEVKRDEVRPFQQEIEKMRREIEEVILPDLDEMYWHLKKKLPEFREKERKRNESARRVSEMMKEYHARKGKR